jgi:hypothetical protein
LFAGAIVGAGKLFDKKALAIKGLIIFLAEKEGFTRHIHVPRTPCGYAVLIGYPADQSNPEVL